MQAAAALTPSEDATSPTSQGRAELVELACAFANSMTLPLIYCTAMLPAADASAAATYIGAYFAAWAPLMWWRGPSVLQGPHLRKGRGTDGVGESLTH
jgi:hypothetical protein